MMKPMRFPAGTYLEVDDLAGGRKVALVCKDGVTFLDGMDANVMTPLAIHPCLNPVELGSFAQFCASKGLTQASRKIITYLRRRIDSRLDSDPLFVMRVLWFAAQKGAGDAYVPDDATIVWASEQAQMQQQLAIRIQGYAEKFCAA